MKNKDFNFIKEKFDRAEPELPPALEEKAIENKIVSGQEHKTVKCRKKRNGIKAFIATAACIVLLFGTVFAAYRQVPKTPETSAQPTAEDNPAVLTFKSYDEINELIGKIAKTEEIYKSYNGSADGLVLHEETASAGESHSETYVQTDGVDEASNVKTDGKYIYYAHHSYSDDKERNKVYVYRADNGKTDAVSVISCKCNADSAYINDIFLFGNRLIVNLSDANYGNTAWTPSDGRDTSVTVTEIYDVSDPAEPIFLSDFEQSGNYVTSRMIGETVYVVSNYYVNSPNESYNVPKSGNHGETEKLAAGDICYFQDTQSAQYNVIGAIDALSGQRAANTRAVFGCSSEVYCNEKNMYLTQNSYSSGYDALKDDASTDGGSTGIIKAELGDEIKFTATGVVDGCVNNSFSMDEKDGLLRIATTENRYATENRINHLYVLDENLNVIGQTEDFAEGESIRAVRFIGNTAYVITFVQTDPLFVIDLSDPQAPVIMGSVEIDGFSSLLVPVNENQLLGIGYHTEGEEDSVALAGLKLALFDISDAANPKVLDSEVLKDAFSPAQTNHKALVVNSEKGYYAMPCDYGEEDGGGIGAITFEIKNGKMEITNKYVNDTESEYEYPSDCIYIGDYVYCIDIDDDSDEKILFYSYKY